MSLHCPKCRNSVPFKQVFFKNISECDKCRARLSVAVGSRLLWMGPILVAAALGALGVVPMAGATHKKLILLGAAWFVLMPWVAGIELDEKD